MHVLAADTKFLDESQVRLAVPVRNIAEQTAALADHLQETAASHVVMLVGLQVLSDFLDAFRQDRNLGTGTTGVILVYLRAFNSGCFFLRCNHVARILTDERPKHNP